MYTPEERAEEIFTPLFAHINIQYTLLDTRNGNTRSKGVVVTQTTFSRQIFRTRFLRTQKSRCRHATPERSSHPPPSRTVFHFG